ncbi:MAG TPA: SGNH/GDSL hydrolase family protein, partial [Nocardioides sp.]|nr:SGNH/GDSL hydrolase family protein [Nocardioides sp.]
MRTTSATALAVLALALAACGGPATPAGSGTTAATGGSWSGRAYVALGDSYTSAPDLGGPAAVSGRPVCGQSDRNYPHLVAARLRLRLDDVSCGGAETASMTQPQLRGQVSVPPQFSALRPDTALVTVGIGGNDFSVFAQLVSTCVQLAQQDPRGAPCTDRLALHAGWIAAYRSTLEARIVTVLRGIRRHSPHARVLVVGYPQIVPATGHCAGLPLATGDYPFARQVNRVFDDALSRAAQRSRATYVDTWTASAGHDICAPDPWIAGATPA